MYFSIITVNVKDLNAVIKRHRVAEWIGNQDPYIFCLQGSHTRTKDSHRLKSKRMEKIFHANGNFQKAWVAILIAYKIDFKTKAILTGKERRYIMIKGAIQKEAIILVNIYVPNVGEGIVTTKAEMWS